jgi:hypothetical protein
VGHSPRKYALDATSGLLKLPTRVIFLRLAKLNIAKLGYKYSVIIRLCKRRKGVPMVVARFLRSFSLWSVRQSRFLQNLPTPRPIAKPSVRNPPPMRIGVANTEGFCSKSRVVSTSQYFAAIAMASRCRFSHRHSKGTCRSARTIVRDRPLVWR